jgi:hypothetical protein
MKIFKSLFFLLLIFFVSCNNNKKEAVDTTDTLSIDLDKISSVNFSDLFTKIEIVPLETSDESLLGGRLNWYYNEKENDYFSFDIQQEIMYCFDENGKFKFSSEHLKGAGPGEYAEGSDFSYNPFDSTYEIMDFYGKINKYDREMKFIKHVNKNGGYNVKSYFIPLNEDMHALYYDNSNNYDNGEDVLYFYSESEDTIKKTIHQQRLINYIHSPCQPFTFTDNQAYLLPPSFSNTLYRLDLDSLLLIPVLNVDYGKKTMTEDIAKNYNNSRESVMDLFHEKSNDYAFTANILQNGNVYCVISMYNQEAPITIYDKNSKKIKSFPSEFSNGIPILHPFLLTDDIWYSCISASSINSAIDMEYLTTESKLRLSQIKEDDNPVIVKYYLK